MHLNNILSAIGRSPGITSTAALRTEMGAIDSDEHKFNRVISCNGAGGSSVEVRRSRNVSASEQPQHVLTATNERHRVYGSFTSAIYYGIPINILFKNGLCTHFCDCDFDSHSPPLEKIAIAIAE